MNRKLSGFLKLGDGLDLFIVFGAVNSPVVQNTIECFGNLSNYRKSYPSFRLPRDYILHQRKNNKLRT